MVFSIPALHDNVDGWGPCTVPEEYKDIPYAPFSKSDRLGKAADWINLGYQKYSNRYGGRDGAVSTVFNFFANDEEDTFHLVDTRTLSRPKFGRRFQQRGPMRRMQEQVTRDSGAGADRERLRRERQQQKKSQWNFWHNNRNQDRIQYTSSVDIRPEWPVLEQIQLSALTKLTGTPPKGEPEQLAQCGHLEYYDKNYDRIGAKQEVPLKNYSKRSFPIPTASSDPLLQRFAAKSTDDGRCVYATDAVLATIMCAPRSVYSWDVVVEKKGDKLWLDKRDRSNFDLLTVHETAQEPIPDEKDMNGVAAMRKESTAVNRNFSQQVLQGGGAKTMGFKEANPFVKPGEDSAPVAYRYRKWKMDDNTVLTARCELQSALDYKGEQLTCTVKALNEFDPKVTGIDWRQKLETQRGAVIATELKNNSNKLAKWTVASLLAGADQMKLGYVTRAHPRDNLNHVILGTQFYKPKDFALQINLAIPNIWAILKHIVDLCFKQQDGKYLLVKDPNKQLMRLYMVPNDAFDEDEFEEEPMPVSQEAPPMAPRGGDE